MSVIKQRFYLSDIDKHDPRLLIQGGAFIWHKHSLHSSMPDIIHRDNDLPAYIAKSGRRVWYNNGAKHRDHGPAIIDPEWGREWWKHNMRHREHGPAVITWDKEQYWVNGCLHRIDGPAVVVFHSDGRLGYDYYINGKLAVNAEAWRVKHRYKLPFDKNAQFHFRMEFENNHEHI